MIVISSATRIKCTPPKLKNRIMCLDHRKWNILAFRGRLMSLLELRSVGSHRGLSSHRSLAYSICWIRYTDLKHYLVDWNERRRLLENTNRFSSCDVMLPELSLSSGNSKWSSVGRTTVQSHEP